MSGPRFRPPRAIPMLGGLTPAQQAEFQAWLLTMFGQVAEDLAQIEPADAPTIISTERVDVPAGATRRVSPSLGGMVAVLAPPSPANSGKTICLIIESPAGELKVVASPHVGADGKVTQTLINDATQATFTLAGVVTFTSNGVDSWKTPAEVPAETAVSSVGLALLGALDATYHLETADPNLPSGRVVVASPDIVPDYTVPGQVSFREGQAARSRSGMPGRDGEDGHRGFPGADGKRGPAGQQGPPGRRGEEWPRPFFAGGSDGWREVLARNSHSGPFNPDFQQALTFTGVFSGSAGSGALNDLAIGIVNTVRFTPTGGGVSTNLTGMVPSFDGQIVFVQNLSPDTDLRIDHNTTSTAANRFFCPGGQNMVIGFRGGMLFRYDGTEQRWFSVDSANWPGLRIQHGGSTAVSIEQIEIVDGVGITTTYANSTSGNIDELQVTFDVDVASDTAAGIIEIAVQSEMETASSTTLAVTPGRQQFHPSACKFWVVSTANSTTIDASYNVQSIVDTGDGDMQVNISNDFSSVDWFCMLSVEAIDASPDADAESMIPAIQGTKAVGSVQVCCNQAVNPWTRRDPFKWHVGGFGDF